MIILHARAPIQPEARERWLAIVDAIAGPTRAEDACRSYHIYEDVETPNNVIFVEEWETLDGLQRHQQSPHYGEFVGALPEVLAGPPEGSLHEVASTQTVDLAAGGGTE